MRGHVVDAQLQLLRDVVARHRDAVSAQFRELMEPVADGYVPPQVHQYLEAVEAARKAVVDAAAKRPNAFDYYRSIYRTAIVEQRLLVANDIERRRQRAIHADVLARLDDELAPYDELLRVVPRPGYAPDDWRFPRLSDFFPIGTLEQYFREQFTTATTRNYDEKFHILQAPSHFLSDVAEARQMASLRGINVAVAYIDIDHFKMFNTEMTESFVDRNVLPKFMRCLEAHVYMRGYAYRFGGDEYCVLLNNVAEDEALASMEQLRNALGGLTYEGTERRTTVSIGVVIVRPDCYLTASEIQQAANRAKNFAKENNRDRVAAYGGDSFETKALRRNRSRGGAQERWS